MTKNSHIPIRRCAGCNERRPKAELVRIAAVDGVPVVDKSGRITGRGIYSCANMKCFDRAIKRKALRHGLKLNSVREDQIEALRSEFPEVNE